MFNEPHFVFWPEMMVVIAVTTALLYPITGPKFFLLTEGIAALLWFAECMTDGSQTDKNKTYA
jgi:hypothetical protein